MSTERQIEDRQGLEAFTSRCFIISFFQAISLVSALVLEMVFNLPIYIALIPNAALCIFHLLAYRAGRRKLANMPESTRTDQK